MVETEIYSDAIKPGEHLRISAKIRNLLICPNEYFLSNIEGVIRIRHHALNHVINPVLMHTNK